MKQYLYFRHVKRGWTVAKTAKDNPVSEDDKKAFGAFGNVEVDEGFSTCGYAQKGDDIYLIQKTNSARLGVLVHGLSDKAASIGGYAVDYLRGLDSDIEDRYTREDPDPVPARGLPKCDPNFSTIDFAYVPPIADALMRGDRPVIIRGENKCAVDSFVKTVLHSLPAGRANRVGCILCRDEIPNMILSADAALPFGLVGTTSKRWGYDNRCYVYNMDTHAFDYAPTGECAYAEGLRELASFGDESYISEYADCAERTAAGGDYGSEEVKFALSRKLFSFDPTPEGAERILEGCDKTGKRISEKELNDCVQIILASSVSVEKEKRLREIAEKLGDVKGVFDRFTLRGIAEKRYGNSPDYVRLCGERFCEGMPVSEFRAELGKLASHPSVYALDFLREIVRSQSSEFAAAARDTAANMLSADSLMYMDGKTDISVSDCIKDSRLTRAERVALAALSLEKALETDYESDKSKFNRRRRKDVYAALSQSVGGSAEATLKIWLETAEALDSRGCSELASMTETYRDDATRLTLDQSMDIYLDGRCRRFERTLGDFLFREKILSCRPSTDITAENCEKLLAVLDATSPAVLEREEESVKAMRRRIDGIGARAGSETELYEFRRRFVEESVERLNKSAKDKLNKEFPQGGGSAGSGDGGKERETERARKASRSWMTESHAGENYAVKRVSAAYCTATLLVALGLLLVSVLLVCLPVIARAGALGNFALFGEYMSQYVRIWHILTPPVVYAAFYAAYFVALFVTKNAKKKSLLRATAVVSACLVLPQLLWDAAYMIVYFTGAV